ncbi:V-type ATP synthase subunit F [Thermanaerovibrio acidaminovorans]|mgnify:CR=1 FL=1|jgi:V/A-type H+-transporting ATPase subunit F|uniref:V-type ATP synthase subunit F n=1 Tax=Thermanaerovibrio acidaminovorans TaxID=81462 RepID=UPI0001A3CF4A|nr:V-type ATP synthase subunit F [Thermanaerovibrio acidaminovorans]
MRAFLVSDNHDSLVAMRLAGIEGVVVHGREATEEAIDRVIREMRDVGILLVTELAAKAAPEKVRQLRQSGELPLLVEIPDRHGTRRGEDFLTRYVQEAIGVNMG